MTNEEYGYYYRLELESLPKPVEDDELDSLATRPEIRRPPGPSEPVDSYFNDKVTGLRHNINQINEEITSRKVLMDRSLDKIDYQITRAASSLEKLVFRIGYNRSVDLTRNFLERELGNLRKERRASRLRFWEDVVQLHRDQREIIAEYRDALRKRSLAGD